MITLADLGIEVYRIYPGGLKFITVAGYGTYFMPSSVIFTTQTSDLHGYSYLKLTLLDTEGDYLDSSSLYTLDGFWVAYRRLLNVLSEHSTHPGDRIPLVLRGNYTNLHSHYTGFYPAHWYLTNRGTPGDIKRYISTHVMPGLIYNSSGEDLPDHVVRRRMYYADLLNQCIDRHGIEVTAMRLGCKPGRIRAYRATGTPPYYQITQVKYLLDMDHRVLHSTLIDEHQIHPIRMARPGVTVRQFAQAFRAFRIVMGIKTRAAWPWDSRYKISDYEFGKVTPSPDEFRTIIEHMSKLGTVDDTTEPYLKQLQHAYKTL